VVETTSYAQNREAVQDIVRLPELADWPLIIAVDRCAKTVASQTKRQVRPSRLRLVHKAN
jgi:hypothetical protein